MLQATAAATVTRIETQIGLVERTQPVSRLQRVPRGELFAIVRQGVVAKTSTAWTNMRCRRFVSAYDRLSEPGWFILVSRMILGRTSRWSTCVARMRSTHVVGRLKRS